MQNDNRLPPFHLGISLVEVLIAMGILTIGLLGVAAIFPVGAFYMQKGDVAGTGSAVAQAAFNEAISRGVLNPENWLVWEDGIAKFSSAPSIPLAPNTLNTFNRPFAEMLRRYKAALAGSTLPTGDIQKRVALEFGSVFIIDPLGIAGVAKTDASTGAHVSHSLSRMMRPGAIFPSSTVWVSGTNGGIPVPPAASAWAPWGDSLSYGPRWPIRRVSLRQPIATGPLYRPLDPANADKLFSSSDDLAMDLPADRSKPSIQRLEMSSVDLNGNGNIKDDPLARQSPGDYSWIITVSPNTSDARDALGTDPSAFSYEVSVVVFYKRPLPRTRPDDDAAVISNYSEMHANERGVLAKIISTGLSGGELLLSRLPATGSTFEPAESPFNILKTGQWVLVCGPHPNSTDDRPMMVARWYRVLAIDKEANGIITDQENQRLVSLRGPQWPWRPATDASGNPNLNDNTQLSNALYVCIPTGAVAVHSKTIHLEGNSVWSGGANGISPPPPPGPKYST